MGDITTRGILGTIPWQIQSLEAQERQKYFFGLFQKHIQTTDRWEAIGKNLCNKLKQYSLRQIPLVKATEIECLVHRVYQGLKSRSIQERSLCKRQELTALSLALKLGGKIEPNTFKDPTFKQFIRNSFLHHHFSSLHMQMESRDKDPMIPIVDQDGIARSVSWRSLRIEENLTNGIKNFYTQEGIHAFQTDRNYRLTDNHVLTHLGIAHHHVYHSKTLLFHEKQDPKRWQKQYVLDIVTSVNDPTGMDTGGYSGQHSYFLLRKPNGEVASIGLYGPYEEITWLDYIFVTGMRPAKIMNPDVYEYMAPDYSHPKMIRCVLTKTQFEKICTRFIRDKQRTDLLFSFKGGNEESGNCTSYVKRIMKEVFDLELSTDYHLIDFIYLKLPLPLKKSLGFLKRHIYHKLPKPIQTGIHIMVTPIRYFYGVFLSVFFKLASLRNWKGIAQNAVTWKDVLCNRCFIDHPMALMHAFEKIAPNGTIDFRKKCMS